MKHEIATPEENGMSSQRLERIKPAMQTYVDRKKIAGISTLIARNGNVVHFELLNRGELDGTRILGRKTVEFMHMNHLPADLLPFNMLGLPVYGYGIGFGSRVLINVAESELPGSVGEFFWPGAAKTNYWVDSQEKIIGLLMCQSMMQVELPEKDFKILVYQALVD